MKTKSVFLIVFTVLFLANVSYAAGTSLLPKTTDTKVISGVDAELLQISTSTSEGASFNKFSQFSLYNQDVIQIINHASLNNALKDGAEADVITLEVDNDIELSGIIELVGRPAELIIATNNGTINCTGCEFKNFTRVSLVTGQINKTLDGLRVGEISVNDGSLTISGDGLKAPGVVFLDLLAGDVRTYAGLSTNLKATMINGQIIPNDNGNLTISTGNTRITLGGFKYNYSDGEVTSFELGQTAKFSGFSPVDIRSGSIRVELLSNNDLSLNQNFITTSDMTMASMYQGKNIIPDESVLFRTAGNIYLSSNITSNGEVTIESGNDIQFSDFSSQELYTVKSNLLSIAAAGVFKNYIALEANKIEISADEIENEGLITSEGIAFIHAIKSIKNQFGGFIESDDLLIQSGATFINGSERAYRLVEQPLMLMAKSSVVIDVGTYNEVSVDPEGFIRAEVDSLQAYIIADNIEIKTGSFKNINPLHRMMSSNTSSWSMYQYDEEIESEVDRVTLHAENTLTIIASEAALNSSAVLETNSGKMALFTPHLTNERYHIQIIEKPGSIFNTGLCLTTNACTTGSNQNLSADTLEKYISYYSPAGRIYSGSDAILASSPDATSAVNSRSDFVNEMSFIEVFGDFNVEVDYVDQTGLLLQAEVSINIVTKHSKRYCSRRVFGKCVRRKTKRWTTNAPSFHLVKTGQLPALFSVEGYLQGSGKGNFKLTTITL